MAVPVKVARQETTPKPSETLELSASTHRNPPEPSESCIRNLHQHTPEPSATFRNLPPEPAPAHTGILRNLPEPASGTYTSTHRNPPEPSATCHRNLHHQHTPEPSGTFRNLPPEPEPVSGTHTSTHRNLPEPSGTFRNLPPEPAFATRTGTHRSLSGLKTPLAYAVGEKNKWAQTGFPTVFQKWNVIIFDIWAPHGRKPAVSELQQWSNRLFSVLPRGATQTRQRPAARAKICRYMVLTTRIWDKKMHKKSVLHLQHTVLCPIFASGTGSRTCWGKSFTSIKTWICSTTCYRLACFPLALLNSFCCFLGCKICRSISICTGSFCLGLYQERFVSIRQKIKHIGTCSEASPSWCRTIYCTDNHGQGGTCKRPCALHKKWRKWTEMNRNVSRKWLKI